MNYIVGRLIEVLSEDEAFWVFTIIIENYLSFDYMLDGLAGAMIDQKVFEHLVNYRYPKILKKFDSLMLQHMSARTIFQNNVISWFQSLFTHYNVSKELACGFIDLFLLRGRNVIFFFGLAVLNCLQEEIQQCETLEMLQSTVLKLKDTDLDPKLVLRNT